MRRGTYLAPATGVDRPVGTGCLLELSHIHGAERYPWLAAGDEVRLAVKGLGEQRARVVAGRPVIPLGPTRDRR